MQSRNCNGEIELTSGRFADQEETKPSSAAFFPQKKVAEVKVDKLKRKLQAAMDYANEICIFGAGNKIADIQRTNGWCDFHKFRYMDCSGSYKKSSDHEHTIQSNYANKKFFPELEKFDTPKTRWFYHIDHYNMIFNPSLKLMCRFPGKDPLNDTMFKLQDTHRTLLMNSLLAIAMRQGNCGLRCDLAGKYLWQHSDGTIWRIEAIYMATFDHAVIFINRGGELKDPSTWGDAWIVDPWYGDKGLIFHASEFAVKIKELKHYVENQIGQCKAIGLKGFKENCPKNVHDIGGVGWEILPLKDRYPSYSDRPLEDYYYLGSCYENGGETLVNDFKEHEEKFVSCLEEIKFIKKM